MIRRAIVESAVARWKSLLGNNLKSLSKEKQEKEVRIKARMINEMLDAAA